MNRPGPLDKPNGRLSLFQRTMLLWNALHPYNAVHVVRVPRRLEVEPLTALINDRMEHLGLTNLRLDAARRRFRYEGGPGGLRLHVVDPGAGPAAALAAEIERQLNLRFPEGGVRTPFRFFAVPEGDAFRLGAVYSHFISDAAAAVTVLETIARAYTGRVDPAVLQPLDRYPSTPRYLAPLIFRHGARWVQTMPRFVRDLLHSVKPRYESWTDHANGVLLAGVAADSFRRLAAVAREWRVTLNDVFLAALVKALAPTAAGRVRGSRRNQIAVKSIVDFRRDLTQDLSRTVGVFLGSFAVFRPLPERASLEAAAQDLHRQIQTIKARRLYLRTFIEMAVGLWVMPRCSPVRQQRLYRQHYPLWGGISNVNLNRLTRAPGGAAITDYLRAVSTGATCPLVLAITTCADTLNVALTFRSTVFTRERAQAVLAEFVRCVEHPSES